MRQFRINDKKTFTSYLFLENTFDDWILKEASFKTIQTITLDGKPCKDYFSSDEEIIDTITWGLSRNLCYQIIKGKHLPAYFKIILAAPQKQKEHFLVDYPGSEDDITEVYIMICFKDNILTVTSGASVVSFPPNKALLEGWDQAVKSALKNISVDFEES